MKISKTGQANISLDRKRSVIIEFNRFGEKGKPYTKELFWLSRKGGYTLDDLKNIAIEAENLLNIANE